LTLPYSLVSCSIFSAVAQIAELTPHLRAVEHKIDSKLLQRTARQQLIERQSARHDRKLARWLVQQARWRAAKQTKRLAALHARMADARARHHQRLSHYLARQHKLESQIEEHQQEVTRVVQQLAQLDPQASFLDVDTETDQLITQLRIAVYNSTLLARERYFGTAYARAEPLTLWRLFFSQDGYYRADQSAIHVTL